MNATKDFCREHGIAFAECGKLIVATTPVELDRMGALSERRAEVNAIVCRRIDASELTDLEPNVAGLGALHLPATGIVDYPHHRPDTGRSDRRRPGTGTDRVPGSGIAEITRVTVSTAHDELSCDRLVVCAGLPVRADRLAELAGLRTDVQIVPFRGEYFKLPPVRKGSCSG